MIERGHKSDQPGVCNFKKYQFQSSFLQGIPTFLQIHLESIRNDPGKIFLFFCYAVGNISFHCESIQFKNRSWYGTKINTSPKSSCLRINNIHLVGICLQTCMANVRIYYMLSYNKDQQACLCCVDFSGSEITDPSWKTYEISEYWPILS